MNAEKAVRELDEDCSVERVKAAIRGDTAAARLDDLLRRAVPLVESGQLSPLAMCLIGSIHHAVRDGGTIDDVRVGFLETYPGATAKWESAMRDLKRHGLL